MSKKELHISWEDFHLATQKLVEKLKNQGLKFDKIIAIARGGMIPAGILGQELDIHHIDTVCISSYCDEKHTQAELKILKALASDDRDMLAIDDLVDSGKTFDIISKMMPNAHFACIYAKPIGKQFVHTYVQEVDQ